MVSLIPERGATEAELHWVAPVPTFETVGEVLSFGAELPVPHWLASARIESPRVLVACVQPDTSWAAQGDAAWAFIRRAAEHVNDWTVIPALAPMDAADERLCAAVNSVLEGEFGRFVASHGGEIELLSACNGVVQVRLGGSCLGCSLSDWTIRMRLERDIRNAAGSDFSELQAVN